MRKISVLSFAAALLIAAPAGAQYYGPGYGPPPGYGGPPPGYGPPPCPPNRGAIRGAAAGAAAGALLGGIISGRPGQGAALGGLIGGLAGASKRRSHDYYCR
jgi:Glycine zipper